MMQDIDGPRVTNGGLDVNVQDQSTNVIGLLMAQVLDTISIVANTSKGDETIRVETTGTVPVVGNFICLQENGKVTQEEVLSATPVSGNIYDIGMGVPLDYAYTTAGGCALQNCDMNVNGSVTPVDFVNAPSGSASWDVTRLIITMVMSSAGDDGLFGNLSALTNGVYMRKEDASDAQNLFNLRDNSDMRVEGYDVSYQTRSGGGGAYGLGARFTFAGQDKRGVTVRLSASEGESIKAVIRDDLTGLSKFRIKIQGHVVE